MLYLTDESDTMMAYEERGRQKRPSVSSYESGMNALQNMGRIPQVEVLHGNLTVVVSYYFIPFYECITVGAC